MGSLKSKLSLVILAVLVLAIIAGIVTGLQRGRIGGKVGVEFVGFPQSFADLAEKVKPAVVNISTTTTVRIPGNPFQHFFGGEEQGPFGDFFKKFFGEIPDRELKQRSLGSGFIIDKDGYIITNNHVVAGAEEIKVKVADGREFSARVIGRDPKSDLALIKISSIFKELPALTLGDSNTMRVGDWVLAIGNPFGLEHTVTQGIISATGRVIGSGPYDNFLQTDAPINPGNSGGPLVNLRGEVIGINSAIIAGGQGIGFAIPTNMAKTVIPQLREKGKVIRGWIGVSIQSVTPEIAKGFGLKEAKGALVADVTAGGPAEKGGIKRGDIIISFDGKNIKSSSDLPRIVAESGVGKNVAVTVLRDGREHTLTITVEELTEKRVASAMGKSEGSPGMSVDNVNPRWQKAFHIKEKSGVVVTDVVPSGPAEDAGIQPGDLIEGVNQKAVRSLQEYTAALKEIPDNQPMILLIKRGRETFYVSIRGS